MNQKLKKLFLLAGLMFLFFSSYSQQYDAVILPGSYVKAILSNSNFERFKFKYKKKNGKYILTARPYYTSGGRGSRWDLSSSITAGGKLENHGMNSKLHLTRVMMESPEINMKGDCEIYLFTPLQWEPGDGKKYVSYRVTGENCIKDLSGKILFTDFTLNPSPPATVPFH